MRIVNIFFILFITIAISCLAPLPSYSREITLFNFEKDPDGWTIPDWALDKKDHVAEEMGISEFHASNGKYALEVKVSFPEEPGWRAAYVERVIDVTDWSPFSYVIVDIFLPKEAPRGLRGRIILTIGDEWKWTEMNKAIALTPGEWTTIKADLTPNSMDWRRFITESFRSDIRKMGVRIESNGKISYRGPIYIDNVKLTD